MDTLNKEAMVSLAEIRGEKCVSLYMPVHRAGPGPDTQQDPIQFKNLLRRAESLLLEQGMRASEAAELMSPASRILQQSFFREHPANGMAMFIAPGLFRYYLLPVDFDAQVFVNGRLVLKPLLKLFATNGNFHVLCLSQDEIRFYRGTRFLLEALPLKNVPPTRKEALRHEVYERNVRVLASARAPMHSGSPIFHGHGIGLEDAKDDICRFFRMVNKGVHDYLGVSTDPLLLTGVEYVVQLYREVNSYPYIMTEHISGNVKDIADEALHYRAWNIVKPYFEKDMRAAQALYAQTAGNSSSQVSEIIDTIVPAAGYGRVGILFLANGEEQWGTYSQGSNTVVVHRERRPEDEDLLNLAAIHTIDHAGTVYLMNRDEMPNRAAAAAMFRY